MTEIKTYRASSMQEALQLVRADLGPAAAVLHTREVPRGLLRWWSRARLVEVTASAVVHVPSRLRPPTSSRPVESLSDRHRPHDENQIKARWRAGVEREPDEPRSLVAELCQPSPPNVRRELPPELFDVFTDLLDAELSEELARELVQRIQSGAAGEVDDPVLLKARLARMVEEEIQVSGPIRVQPLQRRLVALVGPTGVGKTTTIAKLAANFHLRDRRRVGLITVDTYRIAAVEQLRTYADIIDLPMEVVSTPREMRAAVQRLGDLELILMDTAGRSPADEVRIQELKCLLTEAQADEVHLVLSSDSSLTSLKNAVKRFEPVGVTALMLTKLDEAPALGNLLPLLRSCRLPVSYLTTGQNVPDDIEPASARKLARAVLGR